MSARPPRHKTPRKTPAPDRREAHRWITKERTEITRRRNTALRLENAQLRRALRQIVGWYDTFDDPDGASPDLTDADFERFRKLAWGPLRETSS